MFDINDLIDTIFRRDDVPPAYTAETVRLHNRLGRLFPTKVSKPIDIDGLDKLASFAAVRLNMECHKLPTIRIIADTMAQRTFGLQFAGLYLPENGEIWLSSTTTDHSSPIWRDSVIVHETVHYLQKMQGRLEKGVDDPIEIELEAYRIQRQWLADHHPEYSIWLTQMSDDELIDHVNLAYGPMGKYGPPACDPRPEPPFTPFDTEPRD